jgi:flagellin
MATPAASSEAELIRNPEDNRAIEVSMSRLTLEAEAAACRAALLVAIASAIVLCPFVCPCAIATNNAALQAAASASSVNRDMETSMARLSSGKRINSASDDAAGVAIASRLSSEIRGTDQAIRNAMDSQALIDTSEGAHKEIENILQRMREISVQAANDTNSFSDRSNLQAEMNALMIEIDRIASVTTWAGQSLMSNSGSTSDFTFQVGTATGTKNQITVNIKDMSTDTSVANGISFMFTVI